MKARIYKLTLLLLIATLIGLVIWFGWPRYVEYASKQSIQSVGRHSREITEIEVLRITSSGAGNASGSYFLRYDHLAHPILGRKTLTGTQAAELVQLWNHVEFSDGWSALCHEPGFVLRFLVGKRCIFEAAVCFECENISWEPAPFTSSQFSMVSEKIDPKSKLGDLKKYLTKLW